MTRVLSTETMKKALLPFHSSALTEKLDFARYKKVMSYPMWNYVMQAIVRTRSYGAGLEGGLLLLAYTGQSRDKLSEKEYQFNLMRLYAFILRMLDKLDRWDEYLATWESIRSNTALTDTYIKSARKYHGHRLEPFILHEDYHTLYVHFLWGTLHRKELIERKLTRKRAGRKLGNLLHASQGELSDEEIRRRFDWVVELAGMAASSSR